MPIFTEEKEQQIAESLLKRLNHPVADKKKFLVAKFLFHPDNFLEEAKASINSITKSNYEENKETFFSQLPDAVKNNCRNNDKLLCALYIQSYVKDFIDVLKFIDDVSEKYSDEENETTPDSDDVFIDTKIYNDYIQTLIFTKSIELVASHEENKIVKISYPAFEKNNLLIAFSKPIFDTAGMQSKGKQTDIAGNMILHAGNTKIEIRDFSKIAAAFTMDTSKLLLAAIIRFTHENNIGDRRYDRMQRKILIPVREYAALCSDKAIESPSENPAKEKKRVDSYIKYFKKEINKHLMLLFNSYITYETSRGGIKDIHIVEEKETFANGDFIEIQFSEAFAKHLKTARLTYVHPNIFKIQNQTAYAIALALFNQYNNDNNLIAGTADRIKISTLLSYTPLPTIEEVRKNRKSWAERIQEPFIHALEILCGNSDKEENNNEEEKKKKDTPKVKILNKYSYAKTGGIEFISKNPETEYIGYDADYQFPNFETWAGTLIKFELHEPVDHTKRLEQKKAEKEEAKVNKKKKIGRPKKEIDSSTPTAPKRKRGRPKKIES